MANLDAKLGFTPIRYINGKDLSVEVIEIASNNGVIGIHDLLERRSDGFIHPAQASSTTLIGVAAEPKADSSGGTVAYYPLEGLIMKAQVSSDAPGVAAQTDFDLVYNLKVTAPDATTKYSKMEIDGSTGAANAALPLKILRVAEEKGKQTNALGALVKVLCMANAGLTKGAGLVG